MRTILPLLALLVLISSCGVNSLSSNPGSSGTSRLSGNYAGCATGAFVNGLENLGAFQSASGKTLAVVLWYVHWPAYAEASAGKQESFPTDEANTVYANGSVPLITWEPWITHASGTLEAIANGSYDNYVRGFIKAARDWGKPVLLRFAHEMNGNWYPWDGQHNGGSAGPERYKRAWLYIYNVKEELGADNVYLVWCPNNTNVPAESWNNPLAYYPGDQYVDWIGMDGYNWGHGSWQEFNGIFQDVYDSLTALTNKPLMIGEFASTEDGGSKPDWITGAFAKIETSYPRVKLFCWFNINKERDWRFNSTSASESAYRRAIGDSYFIQNLL